MSKFRTPISRVRGLGPAGSGAHHWWLQKVTAVSNLLLVLWFVASIVTLAGADYPAIVWWIRDPLVSLLLIALVVSLFWHLRLGLQVAIEDYVRSESVKLISLVALSFGCVAAALLAIISILKISLGA